MRKGDTHTRRRDLQLQWNDWARVKANDISRATSIIQKEGAMATEPIRLKGEKRRSELEPVKDQSNWCCLWPDCWISNQSPKRGVYHTQQIDVFHWCSRGSQSKGKQCVWCYRLCSFWGCSNFHLFHRRWMGQKAFTKGDRFGADWGNENPPPPALMMQAAECCTWTYNVTGTLLSKASTAATIRCFHAAHCLYRLFLFLGR